MASSFLDQNTTLCLACSSSLPPSKGTASFSRANSIHITHCCQRPICPSCISSNPRLARYNPCLACLGGVDVISASSSFPDQKGKAPVSPGAGPRSNLDGSLGDQDTFVLGDDEDEDDDLSEHDHTTRDIVAPPPPYDPVSGLFGDSTVPAQMSEDAFQLSSQIPIGGSKSSTVKDSELHPTVSEDSTRTTPYKYYLNRKDTLQGIALRFGLDGHEICRMNNLPPSILRTTPHLLHTRSFLLLPPSAKPHPSLTMSTAEENIVKAKLVRERAEKKLQILTKEADWRIAKAYVALADDAQEQESFSAKRKEIGSSQDHSQIATSSKMGLEALAVEQYLDDEEWEAGERRAGRGIQVLPFLFTDGRKTRETNERQWWGCKA